MILALWALGFIVTHGCGCAPTEKIPLTPENAAAVAQYDSALVECKKQAKAAKSFDTYVACEDALTRHYCRESSELRKTWPRCSEVGVKP